MAVLNCRVLKSGKCEVSAKYKKDSHNGIDLVGAGYTLDYIVAHSAGTVVGVVSNVNYNTYGTTNKIYGNYVKIKHDNGMYTLYSHLKYGSVAVKVNQRVTAGTVLGYMGNTGYSNGAHLHFEVRDENNIKIDPTPYVGADLPLGEIAKIQKTLNERYGLNISVDNIAGGNTKRAIVIGIQTELNKQYNRGLSVDGDYGPKSNNANIALTVGSKGNITWLMQARLLCLGYDIKVDGDFGNATLKVVKQFQKDQGISQDGVVYKTTWNRLFA